MRIEYVAGGPALNASRLGERVGAERVRALIAVPPAGFEQQAGAHRVLAADGEVEVLRQLDLARVAIAHLARRRRR